MRHTMSGRYRNTPRATRRRTPLALLAATALVIAACGGDDGSAITQAPETSAPDATASETSAPETSAPETTTTTEAEPIDLPLIVATTTIWADVVDIVSCSALADVVSIIPAGADSHSFEPSLADRSLMSEAALIVANGLDLEEVLLSTVEAVADAGVAVFFVADQMDDILAFDDEDDADGHGHSHGSGDGHDHDDDPHVWFDPVRVAAVLPELAAAMIAAADLDPAAVNGCTEAYEAELLATHDEMVEIFSVIPDDRRTLVTNHDSLGYLADRFDFEVIGTVLPGTSSLAETNPADLADLAALIAAEGVPAIFVDAETAASDAEALASRLDGVSVVELLSESLGAPGSGADTYVGFLLFNARTIAGALA